MLHDHVNLIFLNSLQSASTRSFLMVKVSSSKKISRTSGKFFSAHFTSSTTFGIERSRQGCMSNVCGQRQKVHSAGHPLVV